jgi:hypothetical protein
MQPIIKYAKIQAEDPRTVLTPVTPEEWEDYRAKANKFLSGITKHVYHDCKRVTAAGIAEYMAFLDGKKVVRDSLP